VSRVRENRMHGSRWRREETGTSRQRRAELAPPADPRGRDEGEPARLPGAWTPTACATSGRVQLNPTSVVSHPAFLGSMALRHVSHSRELRRPDHKPAPLSGMRAPCELLSP